MMTKSSVTALGLMSGTSMDGLDCCLCTINLSSSYRLKYDIIDWKTYPYSLNTRSLIQNAINDPSIIQNIDHKLGLIFSEIAVDFLNGRSIDVVGSHGQTIAHQDGVSTIQIGNPKSMFDTIGVPIVYNFRQADINAGGNGAPLIPFLDWLLFRESTLDTITLNIGGIANLSFIKANASKNEVIGFDTGPGMALIDECVRICWEESFDCDGKFSSKGILMPELLERLMKYEFILKPPPKSTGRHEFGPVLVNKILQQYSDYNSEDILRTFVTFTAKSIVYNIQKYLKFSPLTARLIINGGGIHHPLLIQEFKKISNITNIINIKDYNLHEDNKEAFLMAVLATARIQQLSSNIQTVTGAIEDVILGDIWEQ